MIYLAEIIMLPTGLITTLYLARRLGPDRYGQYALAVLCVIWLESSIAALFSKATIKLTGDATDWRPIGGAALRLYLAVGWIAQLLQEPVLGAYLRLFALDIPLVAANRTHRDLLVGVGAFRRRAALGATRWTCRLLLIVLLVEAGLSVNGALLGGIGASLVELIVARFCIRPQLTYPGFAASRLVGAALPLLFFGAAMRMFDKLDLFVLKLLDGTAAEAGIYAAAQNLALGPLMLAGAAGPVLLSTMTRLRRDGHDDHARRLGRHALRVALTLWPFAAIVAGAAGEIVGLMFGAHYAGAAPLLALLVVAAVSLVTISVCTAALIAHDRFAWAVGVVLPMVAAALVGYWLFIPESRGLGAAAVTCAVTTTAALGAVLAVAYVCRVVPPVTTACRAALLSAAAFAVSSGWHVAPVWAPAKLILLGALIVAAFVLLGELSSQERAALANWRRRPTAGK